MIMKLEFVINGFQVVITKSQPVINLLKCFLLDLFCG